MFGYNLGATILVMDMRIKIPFDKIVKAISVREPTIFVCDKAYIISVPSEYKATIYGDKGKERIEFLVAITTPNTCVYVCSEKDLEGKAIHFERDKNIIGFRFKNGKPIQFLRGTKQSLRQ